MEKINITEIGGLCRSGAFRAYARNGGIYMEDTATGQTVRLDSKPDEDKPAAPPRREAQRRSRVERMFGDRETWPQHDDQGPYKGFLMVQCEECGETKAFCAKRETYSFKCACGHETPLEKLRPLFMHCKCGKTFRYKTNLTSERVTHACLDCKAPVDLELNAKGTAYVTVGERR